MFVGHDTRLRGIVMNGKFGKPKRKELRVKLLNQSLETAKIFHPFFIPA